MFGSQLRTALYLKSDLLMWWPKGEFCKWTTRVTVKRWCISDVDLQTCTQLVYIKTFPSMPCLWCWIFFFTLSYLWLENACFCMFVFQSLKSLGYVKEQFAWRHFYWYLTNEGIQYLRDFLHLPPEIVPATLRRQMRPETARPRPKGTSTCRPTIFTLLSCVLHIHCSCWNCAENKVSKPAQ